MFSKFNEMFSSYEANWLCGFVTTHLYSFAIQSRFDPSLPHGILLILSQAGDVVAFGVYIV